MLKMEWQVDKAEFFFNFYQIVRIFGILKLYNKKLNFQFLLFCFDQSESFVKLINWLVHNSLQLKRKHKHNTNMKFQIPQKRTVNNRVKSTNPSLITKTKTKRTVVTLPLFSKKFDENDVFKIDIPEEMMIVGSLDPSLQGKFGQIKSMENGEAVFELLSKKGLETIVIPDFCLTKL
jgi:hypothetical protein